MFLSNELFFDKILDMGKELKKLSRIELLELLIAQQEEYDDLCAEVKEKDSLIVSFNNEIEFLKKELSMKPVIDEKKAEEKYKALYSSLLLEAQNIKEESIKESEKLLKDTKTKCENMILEAKKEKDKIQEEIKTQKNKMMSDPSFMTLARIILNDPDKFKDINKENGD